MNWEGVKRVAVEKVEEGTKLRRKREEGETMQVRLREVGEKSISGDVHNPAGRNEIDFT